MITDPRIQQLCDEMVNENEYLAGRVLPDGSIAILMRLITTTAICLGVNRHGWTRRFCYADMSLAETNFKELVSEDDEPESWVARR